MTRAAISALVVCTCAVVPVTGCRPASPRSAVASARAGAQIDLSDVVRRVRLGYRAGGDGSLEAGGAAWHARVDRGGALLVAPRARGSVVPGLVLATAALGRGPPERSPVRPVVERGGAAAIARGPAVERLRNSDDGVEQSWTFPAPPAGEGALRVHVRASGLPFAGSTSGGLHFADPATGLGVRYGHATWIDAAGRRTPVEARWSRGEIVLAVPAAVVDGSAYPAVLDPLISPESGLDVPLTAGAPDAQRVPAVAFDGSSFLVAWTDRRMSGEGAVYAARVAPDGALLDPVGIAIAMGPGERQAVAVAAGGGVFLVAWQESSGYRASAIRAVRVSAAGAVLDAVPVAVGSGHADPARFVAAFDGTDFRLAWSTRDPVPDPTPCTLAIARIGTGGEVLTPQKTLASRYSCSAPGPRPAIACEGASCLVAWPGGSGLELRRVNRDGGVEGGTLRPPALAAATEPALAFDGMQHLLVWQSDPAATGGRSDVYGARVSTAGALVDAAPFAIAASGTAFAPAVAFDGTEHLVVWEERSASGSDVLGTRVATDGSVLDDLRIPVADEPGAQHSAAIAAGAAGSLVVFEDSRDDSAGDVYAARVSSGAVQDPAGLLVSRSGNRQLHAAAAFDGSAWLVVWEDSRAAGSSESGIYGVRVVADGTILDPAALVVHDGATVQARPAVAGCGGRWTVVWEDHRSGGGADVYAARIAPDGTNLDPGGIPVATGSRLKERPAVACSGELALVAWHETSPWWYEPPRIAVARLAADGTLLDPDGITLSSLFFLTGPSVAAGEGGFLATWQTRESVLAARIGSDGVVRPPSSVCTRSLLRGPPTVAFDGAGFQVFFLDETSGPGRVRSARVSAAGDVLDWCGAELPGVAGVRDVRVAFDGARHVAVWTDAQGGLSGAYVAPGGALLETFSIAPAEDALRPTALGCGSGGRCLVAAERPDAAAGVVRVRVRLLSSAVPPAPRCSAGEECPSGHCVDGVCCDSSCGGGDSTDCLACSVAAGAPADGTCAPATAGTLCRGRGQCDAPERCDGLEGACPADALAPDASPCDDLDRCTTSDACQAGGCVGGGRVVCNPGAPCGTATCNPDTGGCDYATLPHGSPCDDGSACTQGDTCVPLSGSMVCLGARKECPASPCHVGTCDAATGSCGEVPIWDGAWCDDGSACTQGDTCQGGVCVATPKVCAAPGVCQQPALCDRASGECVYAPKIDGTPCDDGDACTGASACAGGTCAGSDAVVCVAIDGCHDAGTCDPATGACSTPAKPDGAPCDDADACTQASACAAGACVGSDPIVCSPLDDCHEAGVCDPATGACSSPEIPDGATCDDGDACSLSDACLAGTCVAGDRVVCAAPADPCRVAACEPSNGTCGSLLAPDGTPCPGGACVDGSCAQAPRLAGGCGCTSSGSAAPMLALVLVALVPRLRRRGISRGAGAARGP